jgi:phosphopentomutase
MRATLIVLDSVGVGAMPDAPAWGDAGADTLGHVAREMGGLDLPNLQAMGLGNLHTVQGVPAVEHPTAAHGRAATASNGKDTIAGHWEMAGVRVEERFREFPEGFPREILDLFVEISGREPLGNYAQSGTVILEELGREHLETGRPIVYTSSDSVFQVAAHEDVVPVDRLHTWCKAMFAALAPYRIGRVIARPFLGEPGTFWRTDNRHDYAHEPHDQTVVDTLHAAGWETTSIGKIKSIFGDRGFSAAIKAGGNAALTQAILDRLDVQEAGLIFANLVDFDMKYGHRRNPLGYGAALEAFDARVPDLLSRMGDDDVLLMTADHGCDPTHPGSDHTREYVPILAWRKNGSAQDLGDRDTMADVGATVAQFFGVDAPPSGKSFLEQV